jgi:hypothetical protein
MKSRRFMSDPDPTMPERSKSANSGNRRDFSSDGRQVPRVPLAGLREDDEKCAPYPSYLMHFCCHVDENAFVRHCPFVNTLRRHHTAHHNARLMMEVNMNLTFPIADWLFGTSDLNRGLVGTLLNGYDTVI